MLVVVWHVILSGDLCVKHDKTTLAEQETAALAVTTRAVVCID